MASISPKHILVTGGSGFLGRAIVKALLADYPDCKVTILDLNPPEKGHINLAFQQTDVSSTSSVTQAFAALTICPDIVVHCAGIVPARHLRYSTDSTQWERVKAVNYDGTRNVLDASLATGCTNFVYTSSCTVVADDLEHDYYAMNESTPLGLATLHYGRSKAMAEQYVLSPSHQGQGLAACALRPCTIIGPGDTAVIAVMHDLIAKGETGFIVGDGANLYDFMYIDNAVHAHLLAVHNLLTTQTAAGQAFFISNQEPIYFWDFLAAVWAHFGHVPLWRLRIPAGMAMVVGFVLEWVTWVMGTASTLDRGSVKDGIGTRYASNEKARRVLGYVPVVGLAEGVRRSCADFQRVLERERESGKKKKKR